MFAEKHFPTSISEDELDDYLDRGWYRMGQTIFTCHFLLMQDTLYSPVWLRLPLEGYRYRKSVRKILERNGEKFRTVFRPASLDEEKEALYQRFRSAFKGYLPLTLHFSLMDEKDFNVFPTYEVAVYDGERLIAASFFDLGKNSIASIKAMYDPEYANASLGIFTMLKEIEFGRSGGFRYYYPGYFVPGNPRFDYKLRMGTPFEVQFFDALKKGWSSYSRFSEYKTPMALLMEKLTVIGVALSQRNVLCQMLFIPSTEGIGFEKEEKVLDSPLFLKCFDNLFAYPHFAVFYDAWKGKYLFCYFTQKEKTVQVPSLDPSLHKESVSWFMGSGLTKSVILESADAQEIVRIALYFDWMMKNPGAGGQAG